ncbi:Protein pellino [Amphibalanus amphitrite]|uniref:Protein pellino n=1 Tax=Amphibalanus amphitrite TaxID=1232801 RepID=A0A6A4V8G3_AMPAM|nr:protein pellino-like [Amphibalanus amphitrite]XP_043198994.1 protein pellino-like [Amphibalanus amphitrite]KAF0292557.1 Protein pellino [Amphibalanus amphitrite]
MDVGMPEHGPDTEPPEGVPSGPAQDQVVTPRPPAGHRYGELVILGYNGIVAHGDKDRRPSKFLLHKRVAANGVKPARYYEVKQPQMSQAVRDRCQHSVSYTLSRHKAIIVEYAPDPDTDLFQVGRSSESPIDFVVLDTIPGVKAEDTRDSKVVHSTISRFACRLLVNRATMRANVYAAGFDSSRNIFLGEKATKWETDGIIDGLTTNGILLMHPQGAFCGGRGRPGAWMEVSVGGGMYGLRATRSAAQKGLKMEDQTSELQDGTLVDLCGATLLWRSAEGLSRSPTKHDLERMVDQLNAGRPQCPVGLNTLVIPRKSAAPATGDGDPWVYLNCGHVQGRHQWGHEHGTDSLTCPMCFKTGSVVRLCMGMEPCFHVDCERPTHAFSPCGHMASEATVRYWSAVMIPHGTNGFHSMCPFCATPLSAATPHVRLIFQDNLD